MTKQSESQRNTVPKNNSHNAPQHNSSSTTHKQLLYLYALLVTSVIRMWRFSTERDSCQSIALNITSHSQDDCNHWH